MTSQRLLEWVALHVHDSRAEIEQSMTKDINFSVKVKIYQNKNLWWFQRRKIEKAMKYDLVPMGFVLVVEWWKRA